MTMSDQGALLAGILERPDCDTRRKVYADYLRENGQEERADFIEVQLELAALSRQQDEFAMADISHFDRDRAIVTKRQEELRRRELRILSPAEWNVPVAGWGWTTREVPNSRGQSVVRWERGFVSAVRCRLADWVGGGPCPRCHGRGGWETGPHSGDCTLCDSTGRTPAHGPRIVAEQPVEESRTEKRPLRYEGRFLWHNAEHRFTSSDYDGDTRPPDHLPAEIFMLLAGFNSLPRKVTDCVRGYPTESAALSSLSLALINWARREAGLPPLA